MTGTLCKKKKKKIVSNINKYSTWSVQNFIISRFVSIKSTRPQSQVLPLVERVVNDFESLLIMFIFSHLLHQFVADGIDFSLQTLLALGCIVVKGKVKPQQVVQGAVVGDSVSFLCRDFETLTK